MRPDIAIKEYKINFQIQYCQKENSVDKGSRKQNMCLSKNKYLSNFCFL